MRIEQNEEVTELRKDMFEARMKVESTFRKELQNVEKVYKDRAYVTMAEESEKALQGERIIMHENKCKSVWHEKCEERSGAERSEAKRSETSCWSERGRGAKRRLTSSASRC